VKVFFVFEHYLMNKTRNLSLQLTAATILFAVLVAGIITGVQMIRERHNAIHAINAQFHQIEAVAVPSLADSVWSINVDVARLTAQGIANQAGVNYVAVTGFVNKPIEFGNPVNHAAIREFRLPPPNEAGRREQVSEPIGTLIVEINQPAIEAGLVEKYSSIFLSNILLITLMAGFVLLLLEWRVISQLRKIAQFVDTRGTHNLDQQLVLKRRSFGGLALDEVKVLTDGVNRMQDNLRLAIEQLQEDIVKRESAEEEVRKLNTELELRVEQRTHDLHLAQASAEQVLDMTESAYWTFDPASDVVTQDDRLARLVGLELREDQTYSREKHFYAPIFAADPALAAALRVKMQEVASGAQEALETTVPYLRKDGNVMWLHIVGRSMRRPDGSITISGSMQNITLRKANEAALEEAKLIAESASHAKADFLANMSHEIRTPMNAIYGMSHLLQKTDLTARQRDYLNKIQQSGEHLLGIINDILDFSKMEAGKLSVEETEFEMDSVLENVANLIGEKASHKGLELIFDVPKDVPYVFLGDPLRLGQILVNFGNNSVKFTERGEIKIVIRIHERTDTEALVYFAVKDSGIGLAQEQMARLFQSFEQADASTTRKYGGTGLGLVICKRLAELMGGSVGVSSELGKGANFWLSVRLKISANQRRRLVPHIDLHGMRLLVVDDNEAALQSMAEMLEHMTFQVDKAESGKAAVAAVRSAHALGRPYAMVLVDWMMPGMDGIETIQKIRELRLDCAPHLAIATAHGREEIMHQAQTVGIGTVLIKPVSASMLFDAMMRVLGEPEDVANARVIKPHTSMESLGSIRGARILLAEDNAINQQVASEILIDAGLQVEVADNGKLAVAMVETGHYDLILMDMQMPVMNGLEATGLIRQQDRFANLPIVAMTANVMQADRDRCIAAGMNDFVAKPIEPDDLFRALLKWIHARQPAAVEPRIDLPDSAAEECGLTFIDGIDIDAGLRRVMGKRQRYVSLLHSFCQTKANADIEIRQALIAGELEDAERLAHTIKGLAGQIGAHNLQSCAEQLETVIREHGSTQVVSDKLDIFANALANQVAAILKAISVADAGVDSSPLTPPAELDVLMRQLVYMLRDDDAKADRLLSDHAIILKERWPEQFRALRQAVREYDFELALRLLPAEYTSEQ
jgi:signal transduction histidine kinase/CheY-like chemotaxis protein/HPt (histidine-containing phosphotransfer) domain-containing protein